MPQSLKRVLALLYRHRETYASLWTVNREAQMWHYLQSPVAGLITDKPDLVLETKKTLAQKQNLLWSV